MIISLVYDAMRWKALNNSNDPRNANLCYLSWCETELADMLARD